MKRVFIITTMLAMLCSFNSQAQTVYKVDINEFSRSNMDEVLEPGYTAWKFPKECLEDQLTVGDAVFTIRSSHNMRSGWNKAFVQTKEFNARLMGDGVNLDPNECGTITLVLKGLAPGRHTIQTCHNSWQDPARFAAWPVTVSLNGVVVHQSVARTSQVSALQDATVLTTEFSVGSADEEVVIDITTADDDAPANAADKEHQDKTPILNGFLIDVVSTTAQARRPSPADADMHVDADDGSCLLSWAAAGSEVTAHRLYLGTDSAAVALAGETSPLLVATLSSNDTTYRAEGLRNLDTYYWRVDEETASGIITRGEVWRFRPRHLAFPGAEGYGRFANGGRGGRVVYVTNLDDDGEGSFRWAASQLEGSRTILFDVSGIITLQSRLVVDRDVTIAGQTAPGKGICLRHAPMGLNHDNICRFVRLRLGHGETADGIGMGGVSEGIMDHCSISWTIDEAFSSRNAKNITLQRTLISEALSMADHKNYESGTDHGFAGSISGDIGSFHHNLLANNSGRNWSLAGGLDGAGYLQGRLDIFNMVVFNWCRQACYNGAHEVNFVNNYYKRGPATRQTNATRIMLTADEPGNYLGTQRYYFAGNVMPGVFDETNQEKGRTPNGADEARYDTLYYKQWVDEPFFPSYAKMETAREAYKNVLSDVGCNMPVFDDHDRRMINETLNDTWHYKGSRSGHYGLIDSEEDCGGYEDYGSEVRPADYDSDRDGLPDWWEQLFGSNPASAAGDFSDANADADGDGFTALEDYLDFMACPHAIIGTGEQIPSNAVFNLKDLFAGFTASPQYAFSNPSDLTDMTIMNDTLLVVTAQGRGLTKAMVSVTDSEGTTYERRLNIAATGDGITGIEKPATVQRDYKSRRTCADGIYTLSGLRAGTGKGKVQLPAGVYIIKENGKTRKSYIK